MRLIRLILALSVTACGGSADQGAEPVAPSAGGETTAAAEAEPAEPERTPERLCAETPEAFGQALAEVFEGYEAPADRAAMEEPMEWSPSLRAWNDLQAERFHVAEGEDHARLGGRYHAWGMGLPPGRLELLRTGPFALDDSAEQLVFHAGAEDDRARLTFGVVREMGCLRLDDN